MKVFLDEFFFAIWMKVYLTDQHRRPRFRGLVGHSHRPGCPRDGVAIAEMGGDESEVDDSSGDSVVGERDADAAGQPTPFVTR